MLVIEFIVGIAAGVLAAMTGGGGGLLFVPFLLVAGLPVSEAVATSNVGILITTVAGTLSNARVGEVPWKRVFALGIPAVLVAPLGSLIAMRMPAALLLILLAVLNVVNAILAGRPVGGPTPSSVEEESPSADVVRRLDTVPRTIVTGGSGGLLAGLFGIGGGLVVVPLQVIWLSTPIKAAVRISLAVIVLSSAGAIMGHLLAGGGIDWNSGVALGLGGLVGAPLGARFLRMVTPTAATRLLQVVLLVVAVQLVVKVIPFA